jgi:glycine/D-amino acid oxidase-like deaminating enzyme
VSHNELDRREFLKVAGVGAGALLTGCATGGSAAPGILGVRGGPNIVVVGAGAFGGWTALNLQRMGARVTLVDMYGPGNSRSTSGDETRGVRTSYGDRPHGELWMQWANEAITRWKAWDAEYAKPLRMRLFYTTGDIILRADPENFTTQTKTWWAKNAIPHEELPIDEVRKRWPAINVDGMTVALYEPNAGVVRARRACEAVAEVFRHEGGRIVLGRVLPPEPGRFDGHTVRMQDGSTLSADAFVFAVGPWLGKTFANMRNRMRTPLGSVVYFGPPPGDDRFTAPNMPSWNFPGVTGWPTLPVDSRGFRVRGGGGGGGQTAAANTNATPGATPTPAPAPPPAPVTDPDVSVRWVDADRVGRSRTFVAQRFPDLKDAPVLETRSCHYESTSSRNFIVAPHPEMPTVWVAGGGNAEGFKMGPVMGEYVAKRVLGRDTHPDIAKAFAYPDTDFSAPANRDED